MALNEITVEEDLNNLQILDKIEDMMACIETTEMRKIKRRDVTEYANDLEKKFPHLKGRYPQIFKMVMMYERTFDTTKLKWMLGILDKRKNGEMTKEQADNKVSFRQFDEHVKPKIDYDREREGVEKARNGEKFK